MKKTEILRKMYDIENKILSISIDVSQGETKNDEDYDFYARLKPTYKQAWKLYKEIKKLRKNI